MIVQVEAVAPRPVRAAAWASAVAPGLGLAAAATLAALAAHALLPGVPAVLVAVALGLVAANAVGTPELARPGLAVASGVLLRAGVVLLGFELVVQDLLTLGARGLGVVVAVVVATFFGTLWAGRRLGVSNGLSLLVATGFSICGVSAIAAARGVVEADEEEVAYAIALVTLCGSLAILLLPLLRPLLGLDEEAYGTWVGASVHDVAQVVATSSAVGGAALATAVVVKLTRVLLLAPLVAWIGWSEGRKGPPVSRLRLVPAFVLAFAGAAALRSAGVVPEGLLPVLGDAKTALLAAALFAVGARVELRRLVAVGTRPLLLGFSSWAIVAGVAYAGVVLMSG